MRFRVVCVGSADRTLFAAAIQEYETRAKRYWPLEVAMVREERGGSRSPADISAREGERLLQEVGETPYVACDERGSTMTSEAFAAFLQRTREGARDLAFVIGGANGLSDVVRERATRLLSIAPWTLPHELARLVLAEQIYRAGTIIRGEPYHRGSGDAPRQRG